MKDRAKVVKRHLKNNLDIYEGRVRVSCVSLLTQTLSQEFRWILRGKEFPFCLYWFAIFWRWSHDDDGKTTSLLWRHNAMSRSQSFRGIFNHKFQKLASWSKCFINLRFLPTVAAKWWLVMHQKSINNPSQNKIEVIFYRNIWSQTEVLPEVAWSSLLPRGSVTRRVSRGETVSCSNRANSF